MIRAFIACELTEELRNALKVLQNELKGAGADVKWVKPEGIHLTFKFLGTVSDDDIEKIAEGIRRSADGIRPFRLRLYGLGAFPSLKSPRVVWVGIREESEKPEEKWRVAILQERLEAEMENLGFLREKRGFHPHLTLGRVRSPRGRDFLLPFLTQGANREVGSFLATEIVLFKSSLLPSGAEYSRLRRVALESSLSDRKESS